MDDDDSEYRTVLCVFSREKCLSIYNQFVNNFSIIHFQVPHVKLFFTILIMAISRQPKLLNPFLINECAII